MESIQAHQGQTQDGESYQSNQQSHQSTQPNQSTQPYVSVSPADLQNRPDLTGEPQWFVREGVPGEGEKPEWLIDGKTMEDQAKYAKDMENRANGLRQQVSKITHAPEEYEVKLDSEISEHLGITNDDPLIEAFKGYAKEADMSQETFAGAVDMFLEFQAGQVLESMDNQEKMLKDFGLDGDKTFEQLNNWVTVNNDETDQEAMKSISDAKTLRLINNIISKTTNMQNIPSELSPMNFKSKRDMQLETARKFMEGGIGANSALMDAYSRK